MNNCRWVGILFSTLLMSGCTQVPTHVAPEQEKAQAAVPRHVSIPTMRVEQSSVATNVAFPGLVAALPDHSVSVAPNISGKIASVMVIPGQHVQRGEVIAVLDEQQLRAQLQQLTAPQKTALSSFHAAQVALEVAQKNLERTQSLFNKDVVAQKDVIAAQNQVDIAKSGVDTAKAHMDEIQTAPMQLLTQLKFTKVRSPINGVVSDRFKNVGDAADPNTPIIHVVDLSTVIVKAELPADSTANPHVGATATITDAAEPDTTYTGTILSISPVVNAQSNTVPVEVKVLNRTGRLKEGQTVTVAISNGKSYAVLVPESALVPGESDASARFVYKVVDGKLNRVQVKTASASGHQVAVMEGLSPGDEIAVSGMYGIPDGTVLDRSKPL